MAKKCGREECVTSASCFQAPNLFSAAHPLRHATHAPSRSRIAFKEAMYAHRSTNSAALRAPHASIRPAMLKSSSTRRALGSHTRRALSNGGKGGGFTSDRNPIARDSAASEGGVGGGNGSSSSNSSSSDLMFNMDALRRRIQNVQMWSSPGLMLERVSEARDERPELPHNVMTLKEALDGGCCCCVLCCVFVCALPPRNVAARERPPPPKMSAVALPPSPLPINVRLSSLTSPPPTHTNNQTN